MIAFDAMTDFLACMLRQLPPAGARAMQGLLRVRVLARWAVNGIFRAVARRRPVVDWGLAQAMHVLGSPTPFDVFKTAATYRTSDISGRVGQDVLLLAGADDHYVPLEQMWDQAALLTASRSVTCRVFSRTDDAQAHCQVGNLPLAIGVMVDWLGQARGAESFNVRHAMNVNAQTRGRTPATV